MTSRGESPQPRTWRKPKAPWTAPPQCLRKRIPRRTSWKPLPRCWVDGNRRMFWSYFFHGVKPKTKGDGENHFRPYLFGDGDQYGSNLCRNRDAARSRRLQPDCRLPCSCRRNEELPGQPRWDCSGVAVRSGHVKKRVAFSTFSPSAGHIIRSFLERLSQISTFVFKHSARVLSTYQPSAPTDFVFPLLWAIQLWSDVLNSRATVFGSGRIEDRNESALVQKAAAQSQRSSAFYIYIYIWYICIYIYINIISLQ